MTAPIDALGKELRSLRKKRNTAAVVRMHAGYTPLPDDLTYEEPTFNWLRQYIDYSTEWSPSAYPMLHEAVGLWLLSTVIAGRVTFYDSFTRRTSLYLLNVADSGKYGKTSTVKIGKGVLTSAQLDHLLIGHSTPQSFFDQCLAKLPSNWDELTSVQQEVVKLTLRHAAQRGWESDEFGAWAAGMLKDGNIMSDFVRVLLKMTDDEDRYSWSTRTHGTLQMERPTLALLASTTPMHLQPIARSGSKFWSDGLWARFAVVAPDPTIQPEARRRPYGDAIQSVPKSIVTTLQRLDQRLGHPVLQIHEHRDDTDGRRKVTRTVEVRPPSTGHIHIETTSEAADAAFKYHAWLFSQQRHTTRLPVDLWSSYMRFQERALRIAAIVAAVEGDDVIDLRRWKIAQAIVERQRLALHWTYDRVAEGTIGGVDRTKADQVIEMVTEMRRATVRDVQRRLKRHFRDTSECKREMDALVQSGDLHVVSIGKRMYYAVDVDVLDEMVDDMDDG